MSAFGTTSPSALLHVAGGDILVNNNQNYASGDSGGTATGILQVDTSNNLLLGATSLTGAVYFYNHGYYTNSVVPMMISSTGNVGIGTASPSYTLQVNGSVAGTSAYVNTSDARLKRDIEPIAYGLDAVMKLRPVGFNWKNQDQDWKKQHQIGLIAQEVETVVPEVVTVANDAMRTESIAYGSLVPVLIQAIQELKADKDNQAKAISELRQEYDAYKKTSTVAFAGAVR